LLKCELTGIEEQNMRRRSTIEQHERRIAAIFALLRRRGGLISLTGAAGLAAAVWHGPPDLPALLLGLGCGLLSVHQARRYLREGGETRWLLMIAFFFAGWPLVQLLAPEHLSRPEQGMLTLQYFLTAITTWGAGRQNTAPPPPGG
jgi:hypothetical protein